LLIFGGTKIQRRVARPTPAYQGLVNFAVTAAVVVLALGTPLALLYRNLPQIRVSNGPMWRNYADLLVQPLLGKPAILMSDDLPRLLLAEAALAQKGLGKQYMFLDTGSLRDWLAYHKYLSERYRNRWPGNPPPVNAEGSPDAGKISGLYLVQLAAKMAETNSTYYLNPSFGYYFEIFYPETHGLIYKLQQYPNGAFTPPAVTAEQRASNEKFWSEIDDTDLKPLLDAIQTQSPDLRPNWADNLLHKMHLVKEANPEAVFLASMYSRSLVDWGVTMQRDGHLKEAAAHFTRALDLNPDNVVAQINLDCNRSLQAGGKAVIDLPKAVEERMGKYRTLENVMNANGPFDEPTFCFQQGRAFLRGSNYRQAGQEFLRVKELVPDNLSSRLLLAEIYLFNQMPDQALQMADEVHKTAGAVGLDRTNHLELLAVETTAHLAKGDVAAADGAIQKALVKYPQDEQFLGLATRSFMNFGCYTNALSMLDLELKINPTNEAALINRGVALLRINRSPEAIAPLTQVLNMETTNLSGLHYAALINRAIAYLQTGKLDESQRDYEELQRALPTDYRLDYGLGEIAYRRKDTNAAIRCYDNYMRNAPTNAPEIKHETGIVMGRLKELKPASVSPATNDGSKNGAAPSTGTNQTSNSTG
jgi:tetratricopeptide (TPR) repeat protein